MQRSRWHIDTHFVRYTNPTHCSTLAASFTDTEYQPCLTMNSIDEYLKRWRSQSKTAIQHNDTMFLRYSVQLPMHSSIKKIFHPLHAMRERLRLDALILRSHDVRTSEPRVYPRLFIYNTGRPPKGPACVSCYCALHSLRFLCRNRIFCWTCRLLFTSSACPFLLHIEAEFSFLH